MGGATSIDITREGVDKAYGLKKLRDESGIPLDAKLTYDLLVSVFQTTSPLHDGAVIVQKDRIAAAACLGVWGSVKIAGCVLIRRNPMIVGQNR